MAMSSAPRSGLDAGPNYRLTAAIGLAALNVVLMFLILDKNDVLPFSSGLFGSETTAVEDAPPAAATATSSTVETNAAPATSAAVETEAVVEGEEAAPVDDWPGGRGPAPEGPPERRRVTINPDGTMTLTGAAPDWDTALKTETIAASLNPGGPEAVTNQITWHPDAPADVRAGDVTIDQAATFGVGDSTINPESFPVLDRTAEFLITYPTVFVVIIGHTDDVGDEDVNADLSLDRATAVFDYLVGKGVVPGQLVLASAGEDDPTASNETAEGREVNRRIELQFKNFLTPAQDFRVSE